MKNILFVKSSILGDYSLSSKYGEKLIKSIKNVNVTVRDVGQNLVPVLNAKSLKERNSKDGMSYDLHLELINEIKQSDTIVIAAPMYNFTIPVQLHAYFDALAIAGETFHYEKDGTQVGHLKGKKAYIILSRGGMYKDSGLTFQETYIKTFLGFLGIDDIECIFLEGASLGKSVEELDASFSQQLNNITFN